MRSVIFCNHYRAMCDHDTCKVDVPYDKFKGLKFDERPCFAKPGKPCNGGCDLQQMPTDEELAAEAAECNRRFEMIVAARQAIVASLGGPWKRGTPAAGGAIDCPCCKAVEALRFSRSGYNGHIHATCSTADCVRWME